MAEIIKKKDQKKNKMVNGFKIVFRLKNSNRSNKLPIPTTNAKKRIWSLRKLYNIKAEEKTITI